MDARVFMAGDRFAGLRRQIAEIEGRSSAAVDAFRAPEDAAAPSLAPRRAGGRLPFALPKLDSMLVGGLRRDALHEVHAATAREATAATGFAVAILARLAQADDRPVLWIVQAAAAREAGLPYGVGLDRFGGDSQRLIVVTVKKPGDALWVFEEGLSCRGLAAVLTEMRGNPPAYDLTASRRLALRARAAGVMGLFLRQTGEADASAAETRWRVAPRPATPDADYPAGIGRPAWQLTLERNRRGLTGTIDVEWDHERRAFAPAGAARAPHPRALAPAPVDRPHPAADPRALVA